jgi:hypothetical protein
MTNKDRNEVILTEEERKFLYLCLKSKNISSLKMSSIKEKILDKVTSIFLIKGGHK